jgi:muconolactone delta-isomerase
MFFMAFLLIRLSASAHLVAQGGLKHPLWRRPGQAASGSIPNRSFAAGDHRHDHANRVPQATIAALHGIYL